VGLVGCGGSTPEIKPSTDAPKTMDPAAKKAMDEQMNQMKGVQEKANQSGPPSQ
jgi:hypothetical protein